MEFRAFRTFAVHFGGFLRFGGVGFGVTAHGFRCKVKGLGF